MKKDKTILIIDDEPAILDMVSIALELAGFECLQAENAKIGHALIIDKNPDLVLLDWMMPGTSGIELLRRLRSDSLTAKIPVIMLTAKATEDNLVQALESGADDYLTKPFSPRELVARINALLRRKQPAEQDGVLQAGELQLDTGSHRVTIANTPLDVGPIEYRLLVFFLSNPDRVYSRDQILDHVWGGNVYIDERTVDVHIRRLRKRISIDGHEKFIQTVRGSGYRFSTQIAVNDTGHESPLC